MKLNEGLEALGTDEHPGGNDWCGVFEGSAVEHIKLPSSLRRIEYSTFSYCKNLKNIRLPERLGYIGKQCFKESALESIILPPTLKVIEESTFYVCENLKSVRLSEGLEKIGISAFFRSGLESVEFPTSLRTVSQAAFAKCKRLKTVTFGEGLKTLGTEEYGEGHKMYYGAFEESSVKQVKLPSTLNKIEYSAFQNCSEL